MDFNRTVSELIQERSSRRAYRRRPIDADKRRILADYLASNPRGPFDSKTRFELVTASGDDTAAHKGLGTYGFIKNPPGFVVGAVADGPKSLEDFGFCMERIILHATDLGLGTCWLGGTFNKSKFAEKIRTGGDETVPAVAAIGHATDKRGTVEKIIRWGAKAKQRRPWERMFFSNSFEAPLRREIAGEYAVPLEMVRLGPSASNKQPWHVVKEEGADTFHFFLRRTPGYGRNIGPFDFADLQRVDMGIAMCHFELTARALGLVEAAGWVVAQPDYGRLPDHTEYIVSWCVTTG